MQKRHQNSLTLAKTVPKSYLTVKMRLFHSYISLISNLVTIIKLKNISCLLVWRYMLLLCKKKSTVFPITHIWIKFKILNSVKDLKIWWNWDFASAWLKKISITRSIFEIRGSSFGFSLIFMPATNHILWLKALKSISKFLIF